ncbi:MAG: methylenetetrahydrofolate--tRNA-(uracil(54)-C(5))-methyltransferase (FADH(2)-oxidizing) TrmFO [Armatimonadia bacterium]|nr:methylenetetrahydrofolate--tRNA-(uracil(54)-C(5))-methyltransferase (FADH(2)-oxidizing) TrmFO [Armatimonadia bacterium]
MDRVEVIGGGLAGCEAAWVLARKGIPVTLIEMRPQRATEAHKTAGLAELVCSNSLKAVSTERAPGLLKAEMRILGSLLLQVADETEVPAGGALAVDRERFSRIVEERIEEHPAIEIERREVSAVPERGVTVLATGPQTSDAILEELRRAVPFGTLRFYDAVSPIVSVDSIDMDTAFEASRYEKGEAAYLNCPMNEEEYSRFYEALVSAEPATIQQEGIGHFEGCLPIEEMARRGRDALRYGPMKPVGLTDPRTGGRPYAVLQLRQENREATMYNMVGFQTGLKWGEQERVFRLIPGLQQAEFLRYGVMHKNTFLDAPRLLDPWMRLEGYPHVLVAGQLSGVEGYMESAASGIYCGLVAAALTKGEEPPSLPPETLLGGLMRQISTSESHDFQPMNANFGLLPPLQKGPKNKKQRREVMVQRALEAMERFVEAHGP